MYVEATKDGSKWPFHIIGKIYSGTAFAGEGGRMTHRPILKTTKITQIIVSLFVDRTCPPKITAVTVESTDCKHSQHKCFSPWETLSASAANRSRTNNYQSNELTFQGKVEIGRDANPIGSLNKRMHTDMTKLWL